MKYNLFKDDEAFYQAETVALEIDLGTSHDISQPGPSNEESQDNQNFLTPTNNEEIEIEETENSSEEESVGKIRNCSLILFTLN